MESDSLPRLRKVGHVRQLIVDGKPFLVLGGEVGNSTPSDLNVLDAALAKCQRMHLNTVMLPVYWDRVEPSEGTYDFSLVRGALDLARPRNLRLVYLWFGSWKNGMSCYAPSWVKRDTGRFKRARRREGEALEVLSPICYAAREADARAFAALMRWTKQYDAHEQTVIMVQVENEIGLMPDARDHSPESEAAYAGEVPEALRSRAARGELGPEVCALWERAGRYASDSWGQLFGDGVHGDEVFAAWHFATYVEHVAAAGKREYPLPMFANAALIRPGHLPGQYPSAGPLPHLMEVWQAGAPSLDMICPDIYFPNFAEWCERYARSDNALFIPEMAPSARAPANAVVAAAQFGAIGFGPFAIENVNAEKERQLANCYEQLAGMSSLILEGQQKGTLIGLSPRVEFDWSVNEQRERRELGGICFEAQFDRPAATGSVATTVLPTLGPGRWEAPPGAPCGAAMVLQLAPDEFVILGSGVIITFAPADGAGKVGIDHVQEGRFAHDGTWVAGRWLNGDETHQGRHVHLYDGAWTVQRVKLYRY